MQLLGPKLHVAFCKNQTSCFPESLCYFSYIPISGVGFLPYQHLVWGTGHPLTCFSQKASGLCAWAECG